VSYRGFVPELVFHRILLYNFFLNKNRERKKERMLLFSRSCTPLSLLSLLLSIFLTVAGLPLLHRTTTTLTLSLALVFVLGKQT
jgi:hypothetical protein